MRARDVADPLWATHAKGESPWLTSAKLKLVDGCNLRCFMCEFWKLRRAGELTTEEVVRVLNELRQLGCLKVHFSGGEIFLRKDALALFRHAAGLGMRVNLTTNGTRIDKDTVKALIKLPVRSITLSIDSPVAQIHDTVRGRDGAFKRTVKTLDRLLERRTRKTRIRINTVISPRNIASMVEMPAFLRTRPVDGWLVIPMDPRNGHDPGWTPEVIAHYNAHIAPTLARDVTVPGFDPWIFGQTTESMHACASSNYARGYYAQHMCRVPWFHTLISATGDVYPCCMGHRR
ncbi:MAG: radical SAM protein, partial [Myxococcota bacterium]